MQLESDKRPDSSSDRPAPEPMFLNTPIDCKMAFIFHKTKRRSSLDYSGLISHHTFQPNMYLDQCFNSARHEIRGLEQMCLA